MKKPVHLIHITQRSLRLQFEQEISVIHHKILKPFSETPLELFCHDKLAQLQELQVSFNKAFLPVYMYLSSIRLASVLHLHIASLRYHLHRKTANNDAFFFASLTKGEARLKEYKSYCTKLLLINLIKLTRILVASSILANIHVLPMAWISLCFTETYRAMINMGEFWTGLPITLIYLWRFQLKVQSFDCFLLLKCIDVI